MTALTKSEVNVCFVRDQVENGEEWRDERPIRKVDVERAADPVCSLGSKCGRCLTRRNIGTLSFKFSIAAPVTPIQVPTYIQILEPVLISEPGKKAATMKLEHERDKRMLEK